MGRKPAPEEESDFLPVGKRAMLEAVKSLLSAIDDNSIKEKEYYIRFTTAVLNKQSGTCDKSSRRRTSYNTALELEIFIEVESAFQAVEDGSLDEGGYSFELITPYFQFTSGEYPPQDKDGCTEHEPCSLGVYFPSFDVVGKHSPSRKRKLLKAKPMHSPGLKKRKTGTINSTWIRVSFRMVLVALVVQTEASPIAATDEQPLTLTAGLDGTIPFECSNDNHTDVPKYYTVTFEGKDRPFYRDGAVDPDGLMSPDQVDRFSVVYVENDSVMSIEIHIASVSVEDQGTYIVMVIIPGDIPEPRLMKQVVMIYIPPGPAACFLIPSESKIRPYEVHCHSKPGNGDSTLTCFQSGDKIPYIGDGDQIVIRRVFWLMDTSAPVLCCAHDIKEMETITEALCNQFQWSQTHVINNPNQTKKVATEMLLTTRPSSNNDEMNKPTRQTTVHSGCAQSVDIWSKAMPPLMAIVAFAVMSNL